MRRLCALMIVGVLAGVVVPCEAKAPAARETKAQRKANRKPKPKKARTKKPKTLAAGSVKVNTPQSLRLAIEDLARTFGAKYPKGGEYLQRLDKLDPRLISGDAGAQAELAALASEALLANPLLNFDKLIVRRTADLGLPANWQSNSSLRKGKYDNEIATLSPVNPAGKLTSLHRPERTSDFVGDIDLHFDAGRMIFSRSGPTGWDICEVNADGSGLRKLPLIETRGVDNYDACYLPDENIIFTSTAAMTGVPCVGGSSPVTNIFRLDTATGAIRRLTFEQDHDWYPAMMNSGRVMYLRWEYSDISHAYSRILFSMNPDGTDQVAYYGSNSYWPNAMFYAREIPGQSGKFVAIVSGHHGLRRMGELVLFDASKGRFEADGVVQRIPGRRKKVEPVILDNVAGKASPRFLHPFPLNENYFLVAAQVRGKKLWAIYLVDVFDNITLVKDDPTHHLVEPLPLAKTARPPVVPSRIDPTRKDALISITDIYTGDGLKGIPRGTIKKLRIFTYNFAYYGMGGQGNRVGTDGPWDVKRIVGTVPVEPDGSAMFRAPANTPLSLQPLDSDGKAVQRMRSWLTAMPGETLSCVGCHERQGTVPTSRGKRPMALKRKPSEITPWYGPTRGFAFDREVQTPVIDKYCIGCHNGKARKDDKTPPDLTTRPKETRGFRIMLGRNRKCNFTPSYWTLRSYVRSTNEADSHLLLPYEFSADSAKLIRMLRKGHHNVKLPPEAWDRLITWIDLSAPYYGTWSENVGTAKVDKYRTVRKNLLKLYANIDENPEEIFNRTSTPTSPVMPAPEKPRTAKAPKVSGWPFDAAEARRRQAAGGAKTRQTLDLGDGVKLVMTLIPAGQFVMGDADGHPDEGPPAAIKIAEPFWMGAFEVTNAQFALFDPTHDSRLEAYPGNNFSVRIRGELVNKPDQPVCRISQTQARAFCMWLDKKTGRKFALPTEAQWEYACRAGTGTPLNFGDRAADHSTHANLADMTSTKVWHWVHPGGSKFNDKAFASAPVGSYTPNAWGLHDMHGNVAEWTISPYARNAKPDADSKVAIRGGSWNDRPKNARSSARQMLRTHERAYDVGFRVICKP